MSEDEPTGTSGNADGTGPTDDAAQAAAAADAAGTGPAAAPKPRPSSTSRARRIGGGAPVAPRPGATPTPTPSSASASADTVSLGKRPAAVKPIPAPAPADTEDDSSQAGRRTVSVPAWAAWVPAVAFFVTAAVFLALLLVNRLGGEDSPTTSSKERQTVLAAAKNCVAATNTYKYTDIDKYERAGVKCTTGVYSTQYTNAMNTLIKKNAPTQKFTQLAQVNSAGIESVTKNGKQWTVLIYGQLNITNKVTGAKGRIDPFGLVATMQQAKGAWVISRVQLLSSLS